MITLNGRSYKTWKRWLLEEQDKPLGSPINPIEYSRVLAALSEALDRLTLTEIRVSQLKDELDAENRAG